jgi:hypothetical protein
MRRIAGACATESPTSVMALRTLPEHCIVDRYKQLKCGVRKNASPEAEMPPHSDEE